MKKYIFIPLMCLLMSSTCKKDNNHFYITIQNQSDNDVYLCGLATNFEGKCTLHRFSIIEKNSTLEYCPFNNSIEKSLRGGGVLEFYLVNPNHYNAHNVFYDCDSIPIKNDILKHYQLTLEDLQQMNWTVEYPPEEQ